jgi:hypothetical protein
MDGKVNQNANNVNQNQVPMRKTPLGLVGKEILI